MQSTRSVLDALVRLAHTLAFLATVLVLFHACTIRFDQGGKSPVDANVQPLSIGAVGHDGGPGGSEDGAVEVEVCDGWDNDGDGEIDEDTDGETCELESGGTGTTQCVNGELSCEQCVPGDRREEDCGCDVARIDICSPQGRWIRGACDGCEQEPVLCECNPGELKIERCDMCTGEDCGSTCVGAEWRCNPECRWEQQGECHSRNPECSRDEMAVEACGNCGSRLRVCDGCFWSIGECEDQKDCRAGEVRTTPCFRNGCQVGTTATIQCNNRCQWTQPQECYGCEIDTIKEENVTCIAGHRACGTYAQLVTCEAGPSMQICDGAVTLPRGMVTNVERLTECPEIECIPGRVETCTTESGQIGTREVACSNQCILLEPNPCEPGGTTCPAGESSTRTESCGCGVTYTVKETCAASGGYWVTTTSGQEACPECTPGEQRSNPCTTDEGACGTARLTCTDQCEWPELSDVTCRRNDYGCAPNTVETVQVSCGASTCGRTFPRTRQCSASGCGWTILSEDRSVCPTCQEGQMEDTGEECRPGIPECGTKVRVCNSQCEWEVPDCPPCQA